MYEYTSSRSPGSNDQNADGPFPTLVLAEKGDDMWLTVVPFGEPPRPGVTFAFLNEEWEIVWSEAVGCWAVPK